MLLYKFYIGHARGAYSRLHVCALCTVGAPLLIVRTLAI